MTSITQPASEATHFAFVGGHPCVDFVNTEIIAHGVRVDLLADFQHLGWWLVESGLLAQAEFATLAKITHTEGQAALLAQVRDLRAEIRAMVAQIVAGEAIAQPTLDRLNRWLQARPGYVQLQQAGPAYQRTVVYPSVEPAHLLAIVAASAADLLATVDFTLIKACNNPDCIRYFVDTTKNHSRRWCSMDGCGNRLKVAAYYDRKRRK